MTANFERRVSTSLFLYIQYIKISAEFGIRKKASERKLLKCSNVQQPVSPHVVNIVTVMLTIFWRR